MGAGNSRSSKKINHPLIPIIDEEGRCIGYREGEVITYLPEQQWFYITRKSKDANTDREE